MVTSAGRLPREMSTGNIDKPMDVESTACFIKNFFGPIFFIQILAKKAKKVYFKSFSKNFFFFFEILDSEQKKSFLGSNLCIFAGALKILVNLKDFGRKKLFFWHGLRFEKLFFFPLFVIFQDSEQRKKYLVFKKLFSGSGLRFFSRSSKNTP